MSEDDDNQGQMIEEDRNKDVYRYVSFDMQSKNKPVLGIELHRAQISNRASMLLLASSMLC